MRQVVDHGGVTVAHGARNPAQQHAAQGDDERKAVHEFEDQLATPDDDGNAHQQAKDDQGQLVLFARALGGAGDGNDVVDGHDQVGHDHCFDSAPELVAAFNVAVLVVVIGGQKLDANPDQQRAAYQFEERHLQQCEGERNQDHPQHDGSDRAPQDALCALCCGQFAAGQGNDHGIVTTQQDVDQNDLAYSDPEVSGQECVHEKSPQRTKTKAGACEGVRPVDCALRHKQHHLS